MSQFTRRRILQGAAGAATVALAAPACIRTASANSKARVATVLSLSGPLAAVGKPAEQGVRLAFSAGARELGVNAELLLIDEEGNPGRALPKVIAAENEGIRLFSGAVISTVGLALSAEVEKTGGLYVASIGADEVTGSQCRRSTFRWPVPSYGAIQQTVRPMIAEHPQAKRWYTITPKFVRGEGLQLRTAKLDAKMGLLIDLATGRFEVVLSGGLTRYFIEGLGIVDVQSELKVVPGPGGKGSRVIGTGKAWVRRLDNSFFAGLTGGLPRIETRLERGTDGIVRFTGMQFCSPKLRLAGEGHRNRDGTFHIVARGRQATYGPLRMVLDERIERPRVQLFLERPNDTLGLRDMTLLLNPTAA